MADEFKINAEFKSFNEPSDSLKKFYSDLYKRNQDKFIRRSKLEISHLGEEFDYDDKTLKLVGSVDSLFMVVVDINDNKYYRIHSDIVTEGILNRI
jgi:hypothetical protein